MDSKRLWYILWTVLWIIEHRECHSIPTKTVPCKFEDNFCGYKQDPTDDFDWSMASQGVWETLQYKPNNYICAFRNATSLRPGSLARLVSPVYEVTTPSLLSLQFKHFKTEGDGSRLRISVHATTKIFGGRRDDQPFFRILGELKTELPWTTLEGRIDVFAPFQLVIEAEVGYFTRSIIAVDDIILTLNAYPVQPQTSVNDSAQQNALGGRQEGGANDALTLWPSLTSQDVGGRPSHTEGASQEGMAGSDDEGVSLCFVLALTSSSLLVIVLVIFMIVFLSLTRNKRRFRRFNFSHDYEEIKGKEAYNQTTSVSAMAIMKERPHPRLIYHNRHTSFSRIQSLSSCLSRLSMRDSLHSSIYAEITDADLDLDGDMSDPGIGNCTTMTTTCTGTWDICSSSESSSGSDNTLAGGSHITASSINKLYPSLSDEGSVSQNDSGWVENIIYERTSDISSFDSTGGRFGLSNAFKGFGCSKAAAGFKSRQRVHSV
ncbi:uncharacterized protein LOC110978277 [Acanthaster planci]|uniref:Uncharacterized protein LOC110978277 n=1 Tax=Acanthaster planci TaxID=133434 RepID=A0A8B7Y8H1_ACAPL|nr:uncharacterized protein LOC110978277 [Acanthaster planci]